MKQGKYMLAEESYREIVAQEKERKGYFQEANDIREGDVFDDEGNPKSYWYVEATRPPAERPTARGQWVSVGYDKECEPGWYWQEWK